MYKIQVIFGMYKLHKTGCCPNGP